MSYCIKGRTWSDYRNLRRTIYVISCALIAIVCVPAFADPELADRNYDLRQFSVQSYSRAFAERFELALENVTKELPQELHAMELVAERHPRTGTVYCNLKVYFDSSLLVYLPEGPLAGSRAIKLEGSHFFNSPKRDSQGRWVGWSRSDRIALSDGSGSYNRAAMLATRDYRYQSTGASQGMTIEEYHKEMLPHIGYMKLGADCSWFAKTNQYPTGWNVWIKRQSGADYRRISRMREEDFFVWPVPQTLPIRFRVTAARISVFNFQRLHGDQVPQPRSPN